MSTDQGHSTFDREIDIPGPIVTWPAYSEIRSYYRVLVNPFLVLLAWLLAVGVVRFTLHWRQPWMLMVAVLVVVTSVFLFQFHCLDCGKTGWLHRLRWHRCDAIWLRWQMGDVGRWHPPSASVQLVIWFYLTVGSAVLIWAIAYMRR